MEMLTKMMDLTHVLEIIVNGQQKKEWLVYHESDNPVKQPPHSEKMTSALALKQSVKPTFVVEARSW